MSNRAESASIWEVFFVVVVFCCCFSFFLFVCFCFCPILLWKLTAPYTDNNVVCLFVSFPLFFFFFSLSIPPDEIVGKMDYTNCQEQKSPRRCSGSEHCTAQHQNSRPCSLVRNTENPGDCFPILLT